MMRVLNWGIVRKRCAALTSPTRSHPATSRDKVHVWSLVWMHRVPRNVAVVEPNNVLCFLPLFLPKQSLHIWTRPIQTHLPLVTFS